MVDGYGTSETVGAVGFGVFVTAMTIARFLGSTALARFGRVATLRATAALGLAGLLLVLLGGSAPVAMAGALLWGMGAALGFPVGMSAAADDESAPRSGCSVVSSIGYTAFLAGPPLIGLLAEDFGILRGLFVVVGALTLGLLAAGAARPLRPARSRRRRPLLTDGSARGRADPAPPPGPPTCSRTPLATPPAWPARCVPAERVKGG